MLDFLICYEHINREVENDALIKYELEKRGYSCEIIPFNGPGFFKYATRMKAKVVITPWLRYDENVFHYLCMVKKSGKLINLQCEQVYNESTLNTGECSTSGQSIKATHLCWGENSFERLLSSNVPKDNVFITGAIQLDYGRRIFDDYYFNRDILAQEFFLNNQKKWILFISSFAYTNYGDEAIKKLELQFKFSLDEQVKLHKASQNKLLDWIDALLMNNNCEFIYRPHPAENLSPKLLKFDESHSAFHIISNYSVKQWAKVCDRVNLWMSTSNAEVAAMGGDFNIVRPVSIPSALEVESMRGEHFVSDVDSFVKLNSSFDSKTCNATECLGRLSYYYSYDQYLPAYYKVVDVLEQVINSPLVISYDFSIKQRVKYGKNELKKAIISFIMERQLAFPDKRIIDRIPMRNNIKQNLKKAIIKYYDGKKVELRMLEYIKKHDTF